MTDHSKTPFTYDRGDGYIRCADGEAILQSVSTDTDLDLEDTNAEFAVKAMNMHDQLVSALRNLLALRNENGADGTYTPQGSVARQLLNQIDYPQGD